MSEQQTTENQDFELSIYRLCNACNKEFKLERVEHNACIRVTVANFEDCPHCGARNDHWIKIDWSIAK